MCVCVFVCVYIYVYVYTYTTHIYIYRIYICTVSTRRRIVVNKFCGETRSEEKTRMGGLNDDEARWTIG